VVTPWAFWPTSVQFGNNHCCFKELEGARGRCLVAGKLVIRGAFPILAAMTEHTHAFPDAAERNPLLSPIRQLLSAARGMAQTEFTLIKGLKAQGLVARDYSFHPLTLFRVHFQVFNALHRLQPEFAREGQALVISPLAIYLRPLGEGEAAGAVTEADEGPLREFYLDWSFYDEATEETVVELLAGFWKRMERGSAPSDRERAEALAELELSDPVTREDIKQQYRRMAMEHHPDRGGSERRLQQINAAMAVLGRSG